MAQKKVCDKCKSSTPDRFRTECEFCGGTSFSYLQVDESESEETFTGPDPQRYVAKGDNYDPSILDGLLDTTFLKYTTRKLASFTYKVALGVVGLIIAISAIFLIWVMGNANTTFGLFLLAIIIVALLLLGTLIWLASLRLRLESFTALVQIARNTQKLD